MSRSVAWRREVSDAASWHQDEALEATIYILREMGPTGFLLKEEGVAKKFKVYLGDPHSCTCQTFLKEHDLCKHICWVLLRKFRVPRQNELTWQLGLVEREVNEILRGAAAQRQVKPSPAALRHAREAAAGGDSGEEQEEGVQQKPISKDDVCPICQEEFFEKHLPVTYCKLGCGNSIHIKCMKVWADHQKSQGEKMIKCPLCREDFGPFSLLQEEMRNSSIRGTRAERLGQHLGATCKQCQTAPIVGKCYKCTVCAEYHLCQNCFITNVHNNHSFQFREKPSHRWKPAPRGTGSTLPSAVVSAMMSRDLGDADYEMLLALDNQAAQAPSDLTEETVRTLPIERVRKNGLLMAPGQQCRVCLQRYSEGQYVRKLPCKHKFHKECIDNWLLHQHATCPLDGLVFTNESIRAYKEAQKVRQQQRQGNASQGSSSQNQGVDGGLQLEIPGVGIASQSANSRGPGSLRAGHLTRGPTVVPDAAGIQVSGTSYSSFTNDGFSDAIESVQLASQLQQHVNTSPMVPVPPSIPRPHNGLDLGIGSRRESPQHRPPSGTQRDNVSAGSRRGRSRARLRQNSTNQSTRQRNGSQTRDQSLERTLSNPNLYLGHSDGELVTNEFITNQGSSRELSNRNSGLHRIRQRDIQFGAESHSTEQTAARGLARPRPREHLQQEIRAANQNESNGDLYIGSDSEVTQTHGSPARIRHGLTGLAGLSPTSNTHEQTHPRNHLGQSPNSLYVGVDPASSEGFLRQFLLNSIAHKNAVKSAKARESHKASSADRGHRWGEVREMSGDSNTMVLSGNRVQSTDNS